MRMTLALVLLAIYFQVNAQDPCSDLAIYNIELNPLNTAELLIHVENFSQEEFYSYPGFRLFYEGEQVAEEEVNFFGLAGYSVHRLPHQIGTLEALETYDFQVELWTGFYDSLHCTFDFTDVPYLGTEYCPEFAGYIQVGGGAQSEINLEVRNNLQELLYDTLLVNTTTEPYTHVVGKCLPEGCYEMRLSPADGTTFPVDVNAYLNYLQSFITEGVGGLIEQGEIDGSFFFDVFYSCALGLDEADNEGIISFKGDRIVNLDQQVMTLHIYDMKGALLDQFSLQSQEERSMSFPIPNIIYWQTEDGREGALKGMW